VQATAATISDEKIREGFLINIPEHREIDLPERSLVLAPTEDRLDFLSRANRTR